MSEYCCCFCGLNHGPDPRSNHAPCPRVRALKFDSDGTVLFFKLKGVKGWQHKSLMVRPSVYAGFVGPNGYGLGALIPGSIIEAGK